MNDFGQGDVNEGEGGGVPGDVNEDGGITLLSTSSGSTSEGDDDADPQVGGDGSSSEDCFVHYNENDVYSGHPSEEEPKDGVLTGQQNIPSQDIHLSPYYMPRIKKKASKTRPNTVSMSKPSTQSKSATQSKLNTQSKSTTKSRPSTRSTTMEKPITISNAMGIPNVSPS